MKWYRVGITNGTRPEKLVEVQAHDASDAGMVACVKLRMMNAADVKITTLECIETPDWARAAVEAAEKATRP